MELRHFTTTSTSNEIECIYKWIRFATITMNITKLSNIPRMRLLGGSYPEFSFSSCYLS